MCSCSCPKNNAINFPLNQKCVQKTKLHFSSKLIKILERNYCGNKLCVNKKEEIGLDQITTDCRKYATVL